MAYISFRVIMSRINDEKLAEEFDIDGMREQVNQIREAVSSSEDPNVVLIENINRANRMLDRIEEILNGEVDNDRISPARYMEVASALINAITTASNSLMHDSVAYQEIDIKRKTLELKEMELVMKAKEAPSSVNNILVCDRETLLKKLRNGGKNNLIEDMNKKGDE